jgi:hypothetical protein
MRVYARSTQSRSTQSRFRALRAVTLLMSAGALGLACSSSDETGGTITGRDGSLAGGEAGIDGHAGGDGATGGDGASENDGVSQGDAGEMGDTSFAAVQAIFDSRCITCHNARALGLPGYAALVLTSDSSYDALVNRPATEPCGGTLVVPGDPDASYLYHKLVDATPCSGARMPRPFEIGIAPPLDDAQLATIRGWILAGARR